MGAVIFYGFLFGGLISLAALGVIMWLNARESNLDRITYDDSFDPGEMVSRYRSSELTDEDGFNPEKTLGRYAEHLHDKPAKARQGRQQQKASTQSQAKEPPAEHSASERDKKTED